MKNPIESVRRFYMGNYYPILVALLVLIGHTTGLDLVFGVLMLSSLILGCFICTDFRFAITPFFCTIFIVTIDHSPNVPYYSRYYLETPVLITIATLAVILIGAMTFFAVRNRAQAQKPVKNGSWVGMAIFCVALCCNGLFSQNYEISNLFYVFSFLLSLLVVYFLFSAYVRFDRETLRYLMYCLVIAGLLISVQLVIAYFTTVRVDANGDVVKESVLLGWGVWTAIGGMLAFLLPACFWLAATEKNGWIGYLLGFFEMLCILLSQSRGALLIGGVVLLLCLICLCVKGEYKKRNRILTLGVAICGVLGCIVLSRQILSLLQNFLDYGFGDNGRFDRWEIGWKHFLDYPVFGSGFYDSFVNEEWKKDVYPYLYHNTLVQILGASGLFGFLTYLYHRVCTVRLVFRRPSFYKTFLGIGIFGLLAFSLLDVLFFNTYPTIFYSMMLLFMDRSDQIET